MILVYCSKNHREGSLLSTCFRVKPRRLVSAAGVVAWGGSGRGARLCEHRLELPGRNNAVEGALITVK